MTDLRKEFQDSALSRTSHATGRPDGVPFDQCGDDSRPFLYAQPGCTGFVRRLRAIQFDQHGVVHVRPERTIDRFQVGSVSIRCQLNPVGEAPCQFANEPMSVSSIPPADEPTGDEFRVGIQGYPCPHIAKAPLALVRGRDVLFLGVAEGPHFVTLDSSARQVAEGLILSRGAHMLSPIKRQREDLQQKRHLLWGRRPLTVCIAALCDSGNTAILIADQRIGMVFVEADTALKIGWLSPTWRVLLAGNDFAAAAEIARWASIELVGVRDKKVAVISLLVRDSLVSAYRRVRLNRVETQYLKRRGWSLQEFKEKGRALLPEWKYAEIDTEIEKFDLEVELLACGFDGKYADIIKIRNPGEGTFEGESHFEPIGSGDVAAISSLYMRGYTRYKPLREALYYVYEAKIAAERASGVGEPSMVIIMKPAEDGLNEKVLGQTEQDALRSICNKLKPQNLSEEDLTNMDSIIRNAIGFKPKEDEKPSGS